jgi:hypothetical protein
LKRRKIAIMKRIIPLLLCVLLLSVTVHAAEPDLPEGVRVTDITERQAEADFDPPKFYPTDIQSKDEDGVKLLLKTFEVSPEVSPAELIEHGLTQNEAEYELRDVLRTVAPDEQERKTVSQTVTVSSESDKREDILAILPASVDYAENGFAGQLTPDESSITTEVEDTEGYTYAVTDTREYPGLVRNDPALLPKTVKKGGVTLTLADVRWSPGSENDPNPSSYSATAFYKGSASGSRPSGYTAAATYTGEVTKTIPGNIVYTLVYAAKPAPVVEIAPEPFNWTPVLFGLGGIVVVGGITTAIVFFLRRRKAVLEDEAELEEVPKKRMRIPNMLSETEDEDEQD